MSLLQFLFLLYIIWSRMTCEYLFPERGVYYSGIREGFYLKLHHAITTHLFGILQVSISNGVV